MKTVIVIPMVVPTDEEVVRTLERKSAIQKEMVKEMKTENKDLLIFYGLCALNVVAWCSVLKVLLSYFKSVMP